MFRTFRTMKGFNPTVTLVGIGLILCYFVYIAQFLIDLKASFKSVLIPISIVLFVLLYWSFLKVYLTEPGIVPVFYSLENQQYTPSLNDCRRSQRRYCLECHNFKPQRTHHCSACGKCVLNMDHHCPWVNNCVGFYNRKFFVLFLFWLIINLIFVLIQQGILLASQIILIIKGQSSPNFNTAIRLMFFLFELVLLSPIAAFMGYHLKLISNNQTTLMEFKRQKEKERGIKSSLFNQYDMGIEQNFKQVFGKYKWQWLLPINGNKICDGINWPKLPQDHQAFPNQPVPNHQQLPDYNSYRN